MKKITAVASLLILLLSGCHKDNTTSNPNDSTHIQFVSASPSEDHPDLYTADGSAPFTPDFYYYLATGYLKLHLSALTLTIKDAAHGTVLTTPQLPCSKDSSYTWFLYDTFPHLKYYLTTNVPLPSLPADKAGVKFVNLSPNAGNLAYRVQGGSLLTGSLGYAGTSPLTASSPYELMDTGYKYIEVVDVITSQVIDSIPLYNFKAESGGYHTIWTTGYRGATGQYMLHTGATQDH